MLDLYRYEIIDWDDLNSIPIPKPTTSFTVSSLATSVRKRS